MRRLGIWVWLLLALGFSLRLAIILKPFPQVDDLVLCDDSYLSWNIARRWALGQPMTFDGIHKTNGFQPLWVLLLVPVYAIFPTDPFLPGKIALVLLALFNVATGIFLFLLVKEVASRKGAYFPLFLWMASPYVIAQGINGLETALALLLMAITLWFYLARVRDKPWSWKRFLTLGLFTGLTMFARLDQVFLWLALSAEILWRRKGKALLSLLLFSLGAFLAISPWLFLSYHHTHSLIPVSGKAVRFLSLAEWQRAGNETAGHWNLRMLRSNLAYGVSSPLPVMNTVRIVAEGLGVYRRVFYTAFALLSGLGLWALWRRASPEQRARSRKLVFLIVFAGGTLCLYSFYIYTYWYHERYQAPVALLASILYGVLYVWLPRWGRQVLWPLAFLLVLPGIGRLEWGGPLKTGYRPIAFYIQKTFPPGAKIGAYQCGAMGYFARDQVVINLDGVVNEEALRAHQEKRAFEYIREQGIEYLVDWDFLFAQMLFPFSGKPPTERELLRLGPVPGFKSWGETWVVYKVVPKAGSP